MSVKVLLKRSQVTLDGYYVVLVDESAIACFGTCVMLSMCLVTSFHCLFWCLHTLMILSILCCGFVKNCC